MGHTVSPKHSDTTQTVTEIGRAIENNWCTAAQVPDDEPSTTLSVQEYFTKANILEAAQQFGEPLNSLKYNYRLLNPGRGVEVAGSAVTWANFYNPGARGLTVLPDATVAPDGESLHADNTDCDITRGDERDGTTEWEPAGGVDPDLSCMNLITAQAPFDFLEPSLNDAYPAVGNWWNDGTNAAVSLVANSVDSYRTTGGSPSIRGVDAVSATIQRSAMINEWSSEAALGVVTDWVVTFPTKGFYVDQGAGRQFAVIEGDRDEAVYTGFQVPYPPFAEAFGQKVEDDPSSAESCNQVRFARYDRLENTISVTGDVIPSPAPVLPVDDLCYESNVVSFNSGSALGAADALVIDTTPLLPSEAGWMRLELNVDDAADATGTVTMTTSEGLSVPGNNGGLDGWSGLPAIGFMIKQRTFEGNVSKNFASSIDHGFERSQSIQ
ncbi:hypothetical protein [Nitrosococcus wardiae]|uniref:Uncharacterized protein n=1 Tax=Nitrosococcus wardiae TaxID=1814290 RepID=A0A4P7BYQ2_9GAMM|nr:hypothetical protein [Nitrosococcus wardiae]QBQ53556.1 hypothetical protein E3U44_02820 [Nitrosococcus wardiae]